MAFHMSVLVKVLFSVDSEFSMDYAELVSHLVLLKSSFLSCKGLAGYVLSVTVLVTRNGIGDQSINPG